MDAKRLEQLVVTNEARVIDIMRRLLYVPLREWDDARSEGLLQLVICALRYDEERGRWGAYVVRSVWGAILDYLKRSRRWLSACPVEGVRLARESGLEHDLDVETQVHGALARLKPRRAAVLRATFGIGERAVSVSDYARRIGVTHQAASKLRLVALADMRSRLAEDDEWLR